MIVQSGVENKVLGAISFQQERKRSILEPDFSIGGRISKAIIASAVFAVSAINIPCQFVKNRVVICFSSLHNLHVHCNFTRQNERLELVKECLKIGFDINARDKEEKAVLHDACCENNLKTVAFLIRKGADINAKDTGGLTPLHIACIDHHLELARLLLENDADITAKFAGQTPLHLVCGKMSKDSLVLAKLLIEEGADVNSKSDEGGYTPLYLAGMTSLKLTQFLIDQGADVNALEDGGMTLLHYSCMNNQVELCKLLLNNNADANVEVSGLCSLGMACHKCDLEIVKLLIGKAASPEAKLSMELRIFQRACFDGNLEFIKKLLAEKLIDINVQHEGMTKLYWLMTGQTKGWKDIWRELALLYPSAALYAKEYAMRASMAHVAEIGGNTTIVNRLDRNQQFTAPLEGFQRKYLIVQMIKWLGLFSRQYPELFLSKDFFKFKESFQCILKDGVVDLDKKLFNYWSSGKPVFIPSGYFKHTIGILLWDDAFIVCDRSGFLQRSYQTNLLACKFDKQQLTPEIIKGLCIDYKKDEEFYAYLYKINKTLNCLPLVLNSQVPNQIVGNCTWANWEGLIEPFLFLHKQKTQEQTKIADESELPVLSNFRFFVICHILEKYLKHSSDPSFPFLADHELIKQMLLILHGFRPTIVNNNLYKKLWKIERAILPLFKKKEAEAYLLKVLNIFEKRIEALIALKIKMNSSTKPTNES